VEGGNSHEFGSLAKDGILANSAIDATVTCGRRTCGRRGRTCESRATRRRTLGIFSSSFAARVFSVSALPSSWHAIAEFAVRLPARSRTEDGCLPMSTMAFRTPGRDASAAGARSRRIFRCSWCDSLAGVRSATGGGANPPLAPPRREGDSMLRFTTRVDRKQRAAR